MVFSPQTAQKPAITIELPSDFRAQMAAENDCTVIKTFDSKAMNDAWHDLPLNITEQNVCGHSLLKQAYEDIGPKTVTIYSRMGARTLAEGTGFFVGKDGDEVVTNAHVINGTSRSEVETSSGEIFKAQIVDVDEINDLALLKISGMSKDASRDVTIGDYLKVKSGTPMLAVGHPDFSESAVASDGEAIQQGPLIDLYTPENRVGFLKDAGLYAALHPEYQKEVDAYVHAEKIASTTPLWHGNSGGPEVDENKKLVGVSNRLDPSDPITTYAVPASKVNDFLHRSANHFDFHYKGQSQYDRQPGWTEFEAAGTLAVGYVGKRFFAPLNGLIDAFGAYDNLSQASAPGIFGSRAHYVEAGIENLAGVAAGVMSLIPRTRSIGYGIFMAKVALEEGRHFLPDRQVLTSITSPSGDKRLPFQWNDANF